MAKKSNKKKAKLKKSVEGVAIPKSWRKAAEKLADNPMILDVVAAGLVAAAAALTAPREAAASTVGDEADKAATKAARKASRARVAAKAAAGAMGMALVDEVIGGKGRGKRAPN